MNRYTYVEMYLHIIYIYIYIHIGSMQYSGYLAATKFVMIVRVISCYLVFQHCWWLQLVLFLDILSCLIVAFFSPLFQGKGLHQISSNLRVTWANLLWQWGVEFLQRWTCSYSGAISKSMNLSGLQTNNVQNNRDNCHETSLNPVFHHFPCHTFHTSHIISRFAGPICCITLSTSLRLDCWTATKICAAASQLCFFVSLFHVRKPHIKWWNMIE